MAWVQSNVPLSGMKTSPSALLNNLTVGSNRLAYIDGSKVVTSQYDGTSSRALNLGDVSGTVLQVISWSVGASDLTIVVFTDAIRIWDAEGVRELDSFHQPANSDKRFTGSVAAVPGRSTLLVGGTDGSVSAFLMDSPSGPADTEDGGGKLLEKDSVTAHKLPVCSAGVDSDHAATADTGGAMVVWDVSGPNAPSKECELPSADDAVTSLVVRGGIVVAAGISGCIRMYSLGAREMIVKVAAHGRPVTALALHRRQSLLASVSEDCCMNIWSLPDFRHSHDTEVDLLFSDTAPDLLLSGVAFLKDGSDAVVATAYDTDHLVIWRRT